MEGKLVVQRMPTNITFRKPATYGNRQIAFTIPSTHTLPQQTPDCPINGSDSPFTLHEPCNTGDTTPVLPIQPTPTTTEILREAMTLFD
ncbi:hypothetical protein SKAU_G00062620 [Synaphobranchus kaupii]|uniref:Uncharacterized protein n=1 Tax=Synaphobranchus kaupii TaxID=118154 RepID=A0A9Q1G576_SYNKA|nr:hypothetical protein SKAU_G00062620 [Synaphobranchus kaupii]